MTKAKQKTVAKEIAFSGVGLHTGCEVTMTVKPAGENTGIRFRRVDLESQPIIKAHPRHVIEDSTIPRCTSIGCCDEVIHTVEHFLSALCGLGITNVEVDIDNMEVPGLDGSSIEFFKKIKEARVVEQSANAPLCIVDQPLCVEANNASLFITPAPDLRISYLLDYDHPMLSSQFVEVVVTEDLYEKEIAPCRTFCLEKEAEELQKTGLGKGANYTNTLVVGEDGVIDNELRFKDEFARHKILDFIGDLYLLGLPLRGHIFATRSGHYLNLQLLKKIAASQNRYSVKRQKDIEKLHFKENQEISSEDIMKVLPHRYPFLLVDKVYEVEKGKRVVGIKNVTANEAFFQGHFPTRPVMPGVLMIEAMAQTAGVVVLTNEAHRGKLAFFMAVDKVKFRKVVSPGDQLQMEVEVIKDKARLAVVQAKTTVDGESVAEAEMMFSFTDASYLD